MKFFTQLALIVSLLMAGILELNVSENLFTPPKFEGEVTGEEVDTHLPPSAPSGVPAAPPPLPLHPRLDSTVSKPSSKPTSVPNNDLSLELAPTMSPSPAPAILSTKFSLLAQPLIIQDEKLQLVFPQLDSATQWWLQVDYELFSQEDALGFDQPAFMLHFDDQVVYQLSANELGFYSLRFNPEFLDFAPRALTLWSGNGGDQLQDSWTLIKQVTLSPLTQPKIIETAPINDLQLTVDFMEATTYLTLEWTSPQTNDEFLGRATAYDIRYLTPSLTVDNWRLAQQLEVILPTDFSPQQPGAKEFVLLKAPQVAAGQIGVRSLDATGRLSPLGETAAFLLE